MVRRAILIAAIVAVTSSIANAQTKVVPPIRWLDDVADARAKMGETRRPMMLFLSVPGCTYCEMLKRDVFAQPWIRQEVARKFVPLMLNGREHKTITERLEVRSYPVVAIVHPDGKVIDVMRGYQKPSVFLKQMAVVNAKLDIHNKSLAAKKSSTTLK